MVARVTAERLSRIWGQQVMIENKPGAGTTFGAEAAAKSDPCHCRKLNPASK